MATALPTETGLDLGRVIQRTFEAIGRNFALFAISALLLVGLPTLVLGIAVPSVFGGMKPGNFSQLTFNILLLAFVGYLVWMLLAFVLQAVLIRATVADLGGGKADLGESIAIALKLLLPLIGLTIVFSIGVGFALMLLIFPGVMLYCAWVVAVPALVEEQGGVFASLGRSRELTKGSRWKIFALMLIYLVVVWVIQMVLGMIGLAGMGAFSIVQAVLSAVVGSATTMISAAGIAVLYVELRRMKDGVSFENLAEIFG